MYKVYEMIPKQCYTGYALVAADSAATANEYIANFKEFDANNVCNSYGWTYVEEEDAIKYLSSNNAGIIHSSVSYCG